MQEFDSTDYIDRLTSTLSDEEFVEVSQLMELENELSIYVKRATGLHKNNNFGFEGSPTRDGYRPYKKHLESLLLPHRGARLTNDLGI